MMKAQFMVLWDGLISNRGCSVIVMGATNRPHDVDVAIRRRMPATFNIGLPSFEKRVQILKLILSNEQLDADVDLENISLASENFSGSDLKELCRLSAMLRVKEISDDYSDLISNVNADSIFESLRPINMKDFTCALDKIKRTKVNGCDQFVDNFNFD